MTGRRVIELFVHFVAPLLVTTVTTFDIKLRFEVRGRENCINFKAMRTLAEKPLGIGLWQVSTIPRKPRRCAASAYSSGSPVACLHSGVWECVS
jgi:hypothetical protein